MPRPSRATLVHLALVIFAIALAVRAFKVQVLEGEEWAERARRQHFAAADIPARRGNMFDVGGVPLAQSRELVRVSVAPRELRDRRAMAKELRQLRVPPQWVARATDVDRAWVTLPGIYLPGEVATLAGQRGVYQEPAVDRVYTRRQATRRVIGRLDAQGKPLEGLELALDSLLTGTSGRATVPRDARGTRAQVAMDITEAPRPGHDIVLTINQELQEISERALADASERLNAAGGDIVILDPHSGEIRAMASLRKDPRSSGLPTLTEPFEPGSTFKPFTVAAALALERSTPDEVFDTENGVWTVERRTIRDVHRAASMTLREVLQESSNVGMAKLSQRLTPREQYEWLRDFGFGTPSGVAYPSEARGVLRPPRSWSRQTHASLAMGYEVMVTPLQLAAAYAVFANGGELLEPTLVREVRDGSGEVRFRHRRRVVRRVVSTEVADEVRRMLIGAVVEGTADRAALGTFSVAGKTGTARRVEGGRGYVPGAYTATFVGIFPADKPQYVVLVKIDNPRSGEYYGGRVAAPVSKVVLEAAIAARDAALDRSALASSRAALRPPADLREAEPSQVRLASADGTVPVVVTLPMAMSEPEPAAPLRAVPAVGGMPLRDAVRELHRAGFRVRVIGSGPSVTTNPLAGTMAAPGALVILSAAR